MHRWQILFNITTLRLISFNMDYYWSVTKGTTLEVRCLDLLI
jgi:protein-cysteine N-palmitoyltransferase HHAT